MAISQPEAFASIDACRLPWMFFDPLINSNSREERLSPNKYKEGTK